jgi:formate hydrogenlyase subunit 6/NADH:ubiquinone oxidoreductase subunit I
VSVCVRVCVCVCHAQGAALGTARVEVASLRAAHTAQQEVLAAKQLQLQSLGARCPHPPSGQRSAASGTASTSQSHDSRLGGCPCCARCTVACPAVAMIRSERAPITADSSRSRVVPGADVVELTRQLEETQASSDALLAPEQRAKALREAAAG